MILSARDILTAMRPPVVDPEVAARRAGVAAARQLVMRQSSFHGWLQVVLLRRHELTNCSCGLINCR